MMAWGIAALICGAGALASWGYAAWRISRIETISQADEALERALILFLICILLTVIFAVVWAVS